MDIEKSNAAPSTEQTDDDHIQEFGIKNYEQPSFYGDCPLTVQ
jgi:hypothetical protein